jgi:hypothetical protein
MSEFRYKEELLLLSDDELVQGICIILAAHSEKFPALRGKAVRDSVRRRFAEEMVSRLRQSNVVFFKRVSDYPLMLNSGMSPAHKR